MDDMARDSSLSHLQCALLVIPEGYDSTKVSSNQSEITEKESVLTKLSALPSISALVCPLGALIILSECLFCEVTTWALQVNGSMQP